MKEPPQHCSKCGRRVLVRVGRFGFNPDTGRQQFWRYAACPEVTLDASRKFVRRNLGAVIGGSNGHYAELLEKVATPRGGCRPGCLLIALPVALLLRHVPPGRL